MTGPYFARDGATLYLGDCLEVMAGMAPETVSAVVTDPPYFLGFMNKGWDKARGRDGKALDSDGLPGTRSHGHGPGEDSRIKRRNAIGSQDFHETWAIEALRVAKPGAHMVAFGGTRTYHRLACAIEDAGWEVRDCLMWLYGSGFPKSHDIAKAIDKAARGAPHGGPDPESPAHGHYKGGCSKENPSGRGFGAGPGHFMRKGARPLPTVDGPTIERATPWVGWGTALKPAWEPILLARKPTTRTVASNVLEHGTGGLNIAGCRVGDGHLPAVVRGVSKLGTFEGAEGNETQAREGRWPANVVLDEAAAETLDAEAGDRPSRPFRSESGVAPRSGFEGGLGRYTGAGYEDAGGPSRFFYTAKASAEDRHEGAAVSVKNTHPPPTVKPVALMRWLVRLVTPPGGAVLDPFAGSGTTGVACAMELAPFVGIEKEEAYAKIAAARLRQGTLVTG